MRIYALRDPRDKTYFYVGSTKGPIYKRLVQHLSATRWKRTLRRKEKLIQDILNDGYEPGIVLLETTNDPEAEKRWIVKLINNGNPILNVCKTNDWKKRVSVNKI